MPLPGLTKVNELVSVYQPLTQTEKSPTDTSRTGPQIVLLLTWGDAQDKYIEKYITLHHKTWPDAKIIVVKNGVAGFFFRSDTTAQKLIEPVVTMLEQAPEDSLFVHIMSNAGAKSWSTVNRSLFERLEHTLSSAPTVLDSSPGRMRLKQTWAAVAGTLPQAMLPRLVLTFVLGLCLGVVHLRKEIAPGGDLYEAVRVGLNEQLSSKQINGRRCYIYSDTDDIIGWEDVEDHAREAEARGWDVELVKYAGSVHVGHFKADPRRYREAIERTWRPKAKL